MENNQQPSLSLYFMGQRTFAGKLGKLETGERVLDDAVEFFTLINPQGGNMVVATSVIGTVFVDLALGILAEMSKESMYYRPYYHSG